MIEFELCRDERVLNDVRRGSRVNYNNQEDSSHSEHNDKHHDDNDDDDHEDDDNDGNDDENDIDDNDDDQNGNDDDNDHNDDENDIDDNNYEDDEDNTVRVVLTGRRLDLFGERINYLCKSLQKLTSKDGGNPIRFDM
jgi:hypothetical protein